MKTAVIIQARITSTRLPGKVLMELAGKSVLAHVLERCSRIPGIDIVCCAVPEGAVHDPVAREAEAVGAVVYRGSEQDVLDRYWRAACVLNASVIVRVTSDCPLIDPEICGRVLRLVTVKGVDYACNNMPPAWPHGLDCEAFRFDALDMAARSAREKCEREHVTPWLRAHPELVKANLEGPGGWVAEQRWTLDFPEDLEFFQALLSCLKISSELPGTDKVLEALRNHPEVGSLNACHHNVSRPTMPAVVQEKL